MKNNFNITITKSADKTKEITLEGDLVMDASEEVKTKLLASINKTKNITLKLINIITIDLAFIQLILAFKNTCIQSNVHLSFVTELNGDAKQLVQNAGLIELIS